jgi:hypothetical protein
VEGTTKQPKKTMVPSGKLETGKGKKGGQSNRKNMGKAKKQPPQRG